MSEDQDAPAGGWRNFYGRRAGKTLKRNHRAWLSEDLGTLAPRGVSVSKPSVSNMGHRA